MSKETQAFWESIHKRGLVEYLGDGEFEFATRGFRNTSEFMNRYNSAESYLDIGPGFGHAIFGSGAKQKAVADISSEAMSKITSRDPLIRAYHIYSDPPTESYDLITCISVVQHCDKQALDNLIAFGKSALSSDGLFYIEGVGLHSGEDSGHDFSNTSSGSHMWNANDIIEVWGGKVIYKAEYPLDDSKNVWWLGLSK